VDRNLNHPGIAVKLYLVPGNAEFMKKILKCIYSILPYGMQTWSSRLHYLRLVSISTIQQEPELNILSTLLGLGDVAVDVGANIGIYTKHLSGFVGNKGKVICIEPFKDTFTQLLFNIKMLRLKNVQAFHVAASSVSGEAKLNIPLTSLGLPNIYQASLLPQIPKDCQYAVANVKTITLDSLLNKFPVVNFIKIDVEGHEFDVLNGATEVLAKHKPTLLVEISGVSDGLSKEAEASINFLRDQGYRPFYVSGKGLDNWTRPIGVANIFFIHPAGLHKSILSALPL